MKQKSSQAKTKRFPYRVTVAWSAEDEVYIARIPKVEGILGIDERDPARAIRQVIERGWDALAAHADNKLRFQNPTIGVASSQANFTFAFCQRFMPLYENGQKRKD